MVILGGNVAENVVSAVIVEVCKPSLSGVIKMGEVRINLSNFVVVGLMAFVAVWAINKGLAAANLQKYQA
jgi:large-conductance mechanosensitive channel